jgi:hypothetical protein
MLATVRRTRFVAFALAVVGCDRSDPATNAGAATSAKAVRDELISDEAAASTLTALQGTFSMPWWRGDAESHPEVWSIDGETITRWDGRKDELGKLQIVAPCQAKVDWASGSSTYETFVIDGDTVWFVQSGGGTFGDRTIVCDQLAIWELAAGKCRKWTVALISARPGGLEPEESACTRTAAGDFEAGDRRWTKHGERLMRADFDPRTEKPPKRFASLAAAKASFAP